MIADLCGLKGESVASESLGTVDIESGLSKVVVAAGMIDWGGYLAKNLNSRGGRLFANAT